MALTLDALPGLAGVLLLLGLAAALLALNIGHRATRVFALFLALQGGALACAELAGFARIAGDPGAREFWLRMGPYFYLPDAFVVAYFAAIYPQPRPWLPRGAWGAAPFALAAAGVDGLYLLDHALFFDWPTFLAGGPALRGPLWIVEDASWLIVPAAAVLFAWQHLRAPPGLRREGLLVVSLALSLVSLFFAGAQLPVWLTGSAVYGTQHEYVLYWAAIALLTGLAALWGRAALSRDPTLRRGGRRALLVAGLAAASGFALFFAPGRFGDFNPGRFTVGVWNLAAPALVAYALARERLFDIDVRVRWTIRQGTIVTAFIATYLIASQLAQVFLLGGLGPLVGLLAAALLALALVPVRRLADAVAGSLLPGVEPTPAYLNVRKLEVYRAAYEDAAAPDGAPGAEAAARLAALRRELGLTEQEHAIVEFAARGGQRAGPAALAPGSVVLGRYRVLEPLGEGAFGRTYLAEALAGGERVAVKALRRDRAGDDSLLREARALRALRDPRVVEVREVAEERGQAYVVSEYMEGGSLARRLAMGPLGEGEFRAVARDLVEALGAVHGAGIVHRDVKPSNVLLTREGRAKLSDFGVAHLPGSETTIGTAADAPTLGTIRYMSPEQARGRRVTPRSDLFSAAATLYEAHTGKPYLEPLPGESAVELQLRAASVGPFRGRVGGGAALQRWFAEALDPDPQRRFGDAAAMRAALERALGLQVEG